jgi:hypothetical protein
MHYCLEVESNMNMLWIGFYQLISDYIQQKIYKI